MSCCFGFKRSTCSLCHSPSPTNTGLFILKKSAGTESTLVTICFQELPTCCVGRLTASPPTQPSRRRPTRRKAAEGPPAASSLLTFQTSCVRAQPPPELPELQSCPDRSLGQPWLLSWSKWLLGLVLFVLWHCLLITLLVFLP